MLFKMSVKNIRRSFKDYTIYFFTLILGVAVFYVFNALGSQTVMLKLSNTMYEILELMNRILSGVSVFVSCILGALILYASRFLIKRRKKEFGIYLLLGMAGVPVFSMMRAGFSVIAGPSGGFIIGFAPMAFVVGLVSEKLGYSFKNMMAATIAGTAVCYILGLAWFMFLTGTGIWASMVMCMFPFLPGDFAKILLASFLVSKYRRRLIGEF